MAVYTEVSSDELETLLSQYDIGAARSCKGIAEGVENSNFYLQTENGPYVLTLYEKRVRAEDLPFFLGLMQHLAGQGLPCPQPMRTKKGSMLSHVSGRSAAILTFLDGISVRKPGADHCRAAGAALAELHRAGSGFAMQRENALGEPSWRALAGEIGAKANDLQEGLADFILQSVGVIERGWPSDLPSGIVHADLFPDNVLFMGSEIAGLIDFYFACNDMFAYDIAVMLNAWCFEPDGAFNVTKGRQLLSGYRKSRALSTREIAALPVLASGAALRFLLTRLHDWFNPAPMALVRPKDPREFARRLAFHRQVKSPAEYGA